MWPETCLKNDKKDGSSKLGSCWTIWKNYFNHFAGLDSFKSLLRPKYTTWLIIYDLPDSLAVLKNQKCVM